MNVSDFDFELPESLIAQDARPRGRARLLVVDRTAGTWHEATIADLPRILAPGDVVVANDTRVFPARLIGRRDPSGGAAECLLLERVSDSEWHALVHPGHKLKPGTRLVFEDDVRAPGVRLRAEVIAREFFGRRLIRLAAEGTQSADSTRSLASPASLASTVSPLSIDDAVDRLGHVPLPPYIHRDDRPDDILRYQTVFARVRGSVAAPTAGLHFDDALIGALRGAAIGWTTITLHVGYGTFKPVRADRVEDHRVDAERYVIPAEAVAAMHAARAAGHRVVAVGTTTTRALESASADGNVEPATGTTELFMFPGYRFRAVDALITNFHLPRSSLLMLVAAFAGIDLTLAAYRYAVDRGFHFYSYGDAMLIV